jgi:hypothetical protein
VVDPDQAITKRDEKERVSRKVERWCTSVHADLEHLEAHVWGAVGAVGCEPA